jgi:DNA repair protein RecN (Recombination protein N)
MLSFLKVKNYKLIDDIEIDFEPKMTVLTGETGAGKSLIVDTLELLLGGRSEVNMIKSGENQCEIMANFDFRKVKEALAWLKEKEFLNEENECLIRRSINQDGRSKTNINGYPCPQQAAKEFAELVINICGQHENHNLLKPEQQRYLLDVFAGNLPLLFELKKVFLDLRDTEKSLRALENINQDYEAKLDLLRYQIEELNNFALSKEEIEKLKNEHLLLANSEAIIKTSEEAINLLSGEEISIIALLYQIKNSLIKFKDINPLLREAFLLFEQSIIQSEEALSCLKNLLSKNELDQNKLVEAENKLNKINELSRKHKVKPEELKEVLDSLENQLNSLASIEEKIKTTRTTLKNLEVKYFSLANDLSQRRNKSADFLSNEISKKISALDINGGALQITLQQEAIPSPSPLGLEKVEFLVRTNPASQFLPLSKIASGGEISRIGLAIQAVIAEKFSLPILVFDEVDVGIGGKTGTTVGKMLKNLARFAQVICVTHLPQVAAQGDHHWQVLKNKSGGISVKFLSTEERVQEIARMLSGQITDHSLAHAKEMLAG